MTVTPLTREYQYNTTRGGYLSYKSPAQLNSTNISASSQPALPLNTNYNATQNAAGRTGQLVGQPLPNSLNPALLPPNSTPAANGTNATNSTNGTAAPQNVQKIPVNGTYNCYRCVSRPAISATETNMTLWSWNS